MARWALFVVSRPWWILGVIMVTVAASGIWGIGVFREMGQSGFTDPGSDSAEVARTVEANFGPQTPDIVAIYTPAAGVELTDLTSGATEMLDKFTASVPTHSVKSYWSSTPPEQLLLRSTDGAKAAIAITLAPGPRGQEANTAEMLPLLELQGAQAEFAGGSIVGTAFNHRLQSDLVRAESIALPITLILLIFIFGGLVAAAVPVLVGIFAIIISLAALRLLTLLTEVNSFALNVASLIGLGLAIDYGLFIVSRFREELTASGGDAREAALRTTMTAGRTVMFSGLLLVCAFAGMLVFPQAVIRSLGFGAIAAVASAAILSVAAVPAVLAVLGSRINALTWRKHAVHSGEARARRFWGTVVAWVMKRPVIVAVTIGTGLMLMATPLASASLGEATFTALPTDDPARSAAQTLVEEFPSTGDGATLLFRSLSGAIPDAGEVNAVVSAAARIDGIAQAFVVASRDDTIIAQALFAEIPSDQASAVITNLRALPAPADTEYLVGGSQATFDDGNSAIKRWLPVMVSIMIASTLALLLLAFGSIVLPLKAVAMACLSLAATFGALTWIFQLGNGAQWIGVTPAPLEATFVVLILAVVFGLSTDYEVFLMARMSEAHSAGATTEESVRIGAERTGRVITAAALLLIVVTGAFTLSGLSIMRFLGVGMILALVLDATLVRMLLVPALVKLMGDANWWAPQWLSRIHSQIGIGGRPMTAPPPAEHIHVTTLK
ncbi:MULTISPECIES: MMPL family transporter [Rhodococcus]|uniref:MMPL family transporter n=1 Tax=Rhodococcus TaxID=1827 RepID=UPI001E63034E|nr:MMPL family transporter [Rhodococcus qingshengii]UGQ55871.1 MMPL family transporter [Rhodococcus qingshengii]BDQ23636.1 MMPL family transporter [Rhodococcus qingshengii]